MVRRTHKYADGGKVVKDHLTDDRPKLGPADPATRRKFIDARLSETEPLRPAPGSRATPAPSPGVSPNTMRLLKNRGKQTDKAVDDNS